ncbi:unnamed protein product [Notodromas monacha]|uniref:Cytochrome c oxidase assembly factor 7 n=1 Tax=Notodromas monacha TaxID=399045 RepID=A0A7R9GCC7_9CRUS|nr:unnamed protein product [Notodromas monacha]CAG0917526.1 unnamed protein product [Notodromas monacha]
MNAKPEDVEEYLKNLGIEYRFGCFSEKRPEVCHLLGDYFEAVSRDFEKAAKIYRTNCDDYKFARSCHKYGNYGFLGRGGVKKGPDTALEYYAKGCDLDLAESCMNGGLLCALRNPLSPHRALDLPRGLKLLEKACTLGQGDACYHLSGMYLTGTEDGTTVPKPDMTRAFQYSLRACELGNVFACANTSQMYSRGDGVEKNEQKATEFKAKAEDLHKQLTGKTPGIEFQQGLS